MPAAAGLAAVLVVWLSGCATAPPADLAALPFPAPDSGPGRPALERAASSRIDDGWLALRRGDLAAARSLASRAGDSEAARLLELQADVIAGSGDASTALAELAARTPEYAAAWLTLSAAAEVAGDERTALDAAVRGAELWPADRWQDRVLELRQRWIGDRLATARRRIAESDPAAAFAPLQQVLEIEPGHRDALLLQARALTGVGEADRAEAVLSGLPRDREVVMLAGEIAEARGDRRAAIRIYSSLDDDPEALQAAIVLAEAEEDWLTVMNLYQELPDSLPSKEAGLRESKLRWRLSVAPPYVRDAVTAEVLDRAGLAVILVTLVPELETMAPGQVPLLSDIVDMPFQRELVTAARLHLVDVDQVEHRFHPHGPVSPDTVRGTLDRLGELLGVRPPPWCTDNGEDCLRLESPISGGRITEIVIDMAVRAGP